MAGSLPADPVTTTPLISLNLHYLSGMTPELTLEAALADAPREPFWCKVMLHSVTWKSFKASPCCGRPCREVGFEDAQFECPSCNDTFAQPETKNKGMFHMQDEHGLRLSANADMYPPLNTHFEKHPLVNEGIYWTKIAPSKRDPTMWFVDHFQTVPETPSGKPGLQ
jgi:hypothetical protein